MKRQFPGPRYPVTAPGDRKEGGSLIMNMIRREKFPFIQSSRLTTFMNRKLEICKKCPKEKKSDKN